MPKDLVLSDYEVNIDSDNIIVKEWNQIEHSSEQETLANKKHMVKQTKQRYKHLKGSALKRKLRADNVPQQYRPSRAQHNKTRSYLKNKDTNNIGLENIDLSGMFIENFLFFLLSTCTIWKFF